MSKVLGERDYHPRQPIHLAERVIQPVHNDKIAYVVAENDQEIAKLSRRPFGFESWMSFDRFPMPPNGGLTEFLHKNPRWWRMRGKHTRKPFVEAMLGNILPFEVAEYRNEKHPVKIVYVADKLDDNTLRYAEEAFMEYRKASLVDMGFYFAPRYDYLPSDHQKLTEWKDRRRFTVLHPEKEQSFGQALRWGLSQDPEDGQPYTCFSYGGRVSLGTISRMANYANMLERSTGRGVILGLEVQPALTALPTPVLASKISIVEAVTSRLVVASREVVQQVGFPFSYYDAEWAMREWCCSAVEAGFRVCWWNPQIPLSPRYSSVLELCPDEQTFFRRFS